MKNSRDKEGILSISPVTDYKSPKIPTIQEARGDAALLKKLPNRWQQSAKVVACIGLMGSLTLSGCARPGEYYGEPVINGEQPVSGEYSASELTERDEQSVSGEYNAISLTGCEERFLCNGYTDFDLVVRLSGGGAGISFYVVHLTEQEAFCIIHTQLEAAGLNFNAAPPRNTINRMEFPMTQPERIGIDLFDREKGVGVVHLSWGATNRMWGPRAQTTARWVEDEFAEQHNILTGVFYNPGYSFSPWALPEDDEENDGERERVFRDTPTAEEAAEKRPALEAKLTEQVQNFIRFLQDEGILTPEQR